MRSLIKQMFVMLFSVSSFLEGVARFSDRTKCQSLNDEPSMLDLPLLI